MSIEDLIKQLDRIAKKNKDEFRYYINIEKENNKLEFHFVCEETADQHTFVDGFGDTIEDAALVAESRIKEALRYWGYKS